ncbi:uncharacterized protein ARB_01258 [Trichophyton benhamiae CBS 112371]|uniref:Uncharacterized protein n=1 Tax=Arthroderma benhamiae (strain ATCC MYA-4681 / CBS 112371) TaxID=663331 RepID=D4AYI9_ARTBC|nr:uncharacterized protein ARB_01258 [Trichophyton benhamiae CBS 112371]EFE32005.1 hypothetical protein ARB_01258 [Trichophyton benhamiae CBS 112371]
MYTNSYIEKAHLDYEKQFPQVSQHVSLATEKIMGSSLPGFRCFLGIIDHQPTSSPRYLTLVDVVVGALASLEELLLTSIDACNNTSPLEYAYSKPLAGEEQRTLVDHIVLAAAAALLAAATGHLVDEIHCDWKRVVNDV